MATWLSNMQNQSGGIMGRCGYWDGANEYMQTATPTSPIFNQNAGAVNFWIKRDPADTRDLYVKTY